MLGMFDVKPLCKLHMKLYTSRPTALNKLVSVLQVILVPPDLLSCGEELYT
jgi:hypothetical protein